jgi:ribonuclease E
MFNPVVQLKSGGYIVIGVTEALVAIDVNSGRATKEGSIEETALKTNLEAAEEVARQLRLRDLAGLIVIDFIDMEERKNNASVEKRLKDKLKNDRARIQMGRISGFGLLEMSRQRLRPGMIEATTQPCPHCHGTGLIRSDDNLALSILRQLEEEGVRGRSREVLLKAPVGIVNFLMNQKREHIAQIEARYGLSVRIEADPFLISPDFSLERFKTATRAVPEVSAPVISVDTSDMPEIVEEPEKPVEADTDIQTAEAEEKPKKRRRRRRRKKPGQGAEAQGQEAADSDDGAAGVDDTAESADEAASAEDDMSAEAAPAEGMPEEGEDRPRKTRNRRSRNRKAERADAAPAAADQQEDAGPGEAEAPAATGAPAVTEPGEAGPAATEPAATGPAATEAAEAVPADDGPADSEPVDRGPVDSGPAENGPAAEAEIAQGQPEAAEAEPAPASPEPHPAPEPAAATPAPSEPQGAESGDADEESDGRPKKRGWWSLGR